MDRVPARFVPLGDLRPPLGAPGRGWTQEFDPSGDSHTKGRTQGTTRATGFDKGVRIGKMKPSYVYQLILNRLRFELGLNRE